jgi:hypothetical protein
MVRAPEREKTVPLGVILSSKTKEAVREWNARQKKRHQNIKAKSGGQPRSQRERKQIRQTGSASRGEFIAQKISPLLPEEGFSQIFSKHINSCLQGENFSDQLEKVSQSLEKLNKEQVNLTFRFYQIRQGFAKNPEQADLTRKKITEFNLKNIDQIPPDGFLPGLLRIISNLYPDPQSLKEKR